MTTTSETGAAGIAAAELYERYGNKIYRYCVCRLRDREEAADATQNTFLRVYVALEKGVVPEYEASWLYKIAHNVCLTSIESSGRRALVETPRDLDKLDEAVLAAPASEHEAVEELAEALAALPHNLRQAILLREWQGLSYTEIAAAMDTTVSAVETLLVRARRELKATLEKNGARLRTTAAGLFDVPGLRAFFSGLLGKVSAGAALIAIGTSGIAATYVLADTPSSPHVRPAASVAQLTSAVFAASRTADAELAPRGLSAVARRATDPVSSVDARHSGDTSAPPVVSPPTVEPSTRLPEVAVTPLPLPQATTTATTTLASLPSPPLAETVPAPELPVTAPAVTVPTLPTEAVTAEAVTVAAVTTPAITIP